MREIRDAVAVPVETFAKMPQRAINGRATTVPSHQVREGDRIEVRETSRSTEHFKQVKDTLRSAQRPDWLTVDADKLAGNIAGSPRRDQMPLELNEQLVVEYYSR